MKRAVVHSRQTGEALRQLAETVKGIDVRRLDPIGHEAHKGILVKFDAHDQLNGGQAEVIVGAEQRHGVPDEVNSAFIEAIVFQQFSAAHGLQVSALGGLWISWIELVDIDDKVLKGA